MAICNGFLFRLEFEKNEEVIVDRSEVRGIVKDVFVDTASGTVEYGVVVPYGSVQTIRGYCTSHIRCTEKELRKNKYKSIWEIFFK